MTTTTNESKQPIEEIIDYQMLYEEEKKKVAVL